MARYRVVLNVEEYSVVVDKEFEVSSATEWLEELRAEAADIVASSTPFFLRSVARARVLGLPHAEAEHA